MSRTCRKLFTMKIRKKCKRVFGHCQVAIFKQRFEIDIGHKLFLLSLRINYTLMHLHLQHIDEHIHWKTFSFETFLCTQGSYQELYHLKNV